MRYKLFGRSGLRVSELCLGTMTFGTEWGWGADYETSKKLFDTYVNAGGNFLDTANRYTEGTSEKYVGEFINADRDHFVLATKYTLYDRKEDVNFSGNHRKNLFRSVEASLRRLKTDYIDLLWLHAWDFTTSVEEVLRGLDDLVRAGKIHYLGISDTPAWIVSMSNTMAELRGWTAFSGLQVQYNLAERSPEHDLLPMAKAFDLAVTPWAPLAAGLLTGKYLDGGSDGRLTGKRKHLTGRNMSIAAEVVDIAQKLGVSPAQVAINWTRQRNQVVIPILGVRKVEQLEDNLKSVEFTIPDEMMHMLNEMSAIELGFPHKFLHSEGVKENIYGGTYKKIINHRF